MTEADRLDQINNALNALRPAWPHFAAVLNERIADATLKLISENDEQTRGRIKALRDLLNLPETLQQERDGITAELPETDSAI